MTEGERLDIAVAAAGLARSRSEAAALIRSGAITVDGRVINKPAAIVTAAAELAGHGERWVSRAALKLTGALDALDLTVGGRALDAGASTGGFSQVLLRRGCTEVYAVDVGHGQLAEPVRGDHRVHNLEGLHLRDLTVADLGAPVDQAVADVSFISLTKVLAPILRVVDPAGWALLLVKPQFELGRAALDKHGVVTDPDSHRRAVDGVVATGVGLGWRHAATVPSELPGTHGNREYFVHLLGPRHPGERGAEPGGTP
ncbi:TlyA family RNA methyltransferase [Naumannella huperziae]